MDLESYGQVVQQAEELVRKVMSRWDSSHDAFHAFRVRDLALSLASEELLPPQPRQIVELAALLHDIDDHKYVSRQKEDPHDTVDEFLTRCKVPPLVAQSVNHIIQNMGFKEELSGSSDAQHSIEFGIVQDADRLDAMGAIGIARAFTYGGSRNRTIHDPSAPACINMTKEEYMRQERKQTGVNHFHEKLLKLKDLMKTQAGRRRAEGRHKFLEDYLTQFDGEWEGKL